MFRSVKFSGIPFRRDGLHSEPAQRNCTSSEKCPHFLSSINDIPGRTGAFDFSSQNTMTENWPHERKKEKNGSNYVAWKKGLRKKMMQRSEETMSFV